MNARLSRRLIFTLFVAFAGYFLAHAATRAQDVDSPSVLDQRAVERNAAPMRKIDPTTERLPFAGLAAQSPERQAEELVGKSAQELVDAGVALLNAQMFRDALVLLEKASLDSETSGVLLQRSVPNLCNALQQAREWSRLEDDLETILAARPDDWRVALLVAENLAGLPNRAVEIDGKLEYSTDWRDDAVSIAARQRVRRLQIYRAALPLVRAQYAKSPDEYSDLEKEYEETLAFSLERRGAEFYNSFISTIENFGFGEGYWRLQVLTNIDELPESEPFDVARGGSRRQGAPVDSDGNPVFFKTPDSFESAANDGERVQALRREIFERASANAKASILVARGDEAQRLFGIQTLLNANFGEEIKEGPWSLATLEDSETIATVATGVKRFSLPAEYDYLALWRESLEYKRDFNVYRRIANEYASRRQLTKSAAAWREALDAIASGKLARTAITDRQIEEARNAIGQIEEPRIAIDAAGSRADGLRAELSVRFRNARRLETTIRALKVDRILEEFRSESFWKKNPYNSVQSRLVELLREDYDKQRGLVGKIFATKFVGEEVARFTTEVEPDPEHYDVVASVAAPKLPSGAYLVEIRAENGSVDAAVVWLRDRALVKRQEAKGERYYLVDAETGAPQPNAPIDFIVKREYYRNKRKVEIETQRRFTDEQGGALVSYMSEPNVNVTMFTYASSRDANNPNGWTFFDFEGVWGFNLYDQNFTNDRAFFVSDRPIYRPKQDAHFKFWLGTARYGLPEEENLWSGRQVACVITSPTGETLVAKDGITLDEYGAFSDTFQIPGDAKLGVYNVSVGYALDQNKNLDIYLGGGSFRLEEYRKPEFKVSVDAPKEPIALGEKFKATVRADYYFGAPVANATVRYVVRRNRRVSNYYPARYWDWFYGPGYWQFAYDCPWYPGASLWACKRLPFFFDSFPLEAPELLLEGEAPIASDGTFEIEIDSELAKLIWPNDDQEYEIEATVTDQSRRAITGRGKVIAARSPFETYVWFDRGWFKSGDKMTAHFQARRLDGKPVVGKAVVKLLRVSYASNDLDEIVPIEEEVFVEETRTDADGFGAVEMSASAPGQYRLSCVVTTDSGLAREGGQLVMVRGATQKVASSGQARGDYRFNALEIIPDKPEYSVGDVAQIQISSNRANAYVLLTTRVEDGAVGDETRLVQLTNGTALVEVPIEAKDQPNVFIEASTVFEGRFYSQLKELAVPPEQRVLDVAVEPTQERVKPGEKAKIKLRLTDPNGEPVVGQTVATIYDASLDAVAGGSNIPEIREFFWKWRRYARATTQSNLGLTSLSGVFGVVFSGDAEAQRLRLAPIGIFNDSFSGALGAKNAAGRLVTKFRGSPMAAGGMGGMGGGFARRESMAFSDAVEEEDTAEADMEIADEAQSFDAATAVPMAAPMLKMETASARDLSAGLNGADAKQDGGGETFVEAKTRSNLQDLAFWAADLKPDDDGAIEIEVDMPENLTTWKIAAWSVGSGLRVGSGEASIITSKDLIVRMQKPRFLTQKDEVVLTANVHNYLSEEKTVQVSLEFPNDDPEKSTAKLAFLEPDAAIQRVVAPANGEARVDWLVRAETPGVATMVMKALTNEESDAVQDVIVVREHGIDKQLAVSGMVPAVVRNDDDADDDANNAEPTIREEKFSLVVPEERRPETTKLTVRFSPTLAGAIFDALPYMMEYPYGCTEQTLNKFLPLVVAQKALMDAGVDLAALQARRANLNAQEFGDPAERAARRLAARRLSEPVFDPAEARARAESGIRRLLDMQNADGGWGWFSGDGGWSTARLTALVSRGLKRAQDCDFAVDENALARGRAWLEDYERKETVKLIRGRVWTDEQKNARDAWNQWKSEADDTDALVYFALAEFGLQPSEYRESFVDYKSAALRVGDAADVHAVAKELIWDARASLQLSTVAQFALALTSEPAPSDATLARIEEILRLLSQYRKVDDENQTVWLDLGRVRGWCFWSWFGGEYETQAHYLRLLNRAEASTLARAGLADDAPKLVKYLLNNRRNATYWNSTRDTAFIVEAFAEYLGKTNELAPRMKVEVRVDGELKKTVEYSPETVFETDGTVELSADELSSGEHEIALRLEGDAPLYYNAYLEFFTLEDPIEKSGLEVKVERRYYKLVPRKDATALVQGGRGQAIEQRAEIYDRVMLQTGDEIVSGDLIEAELIVDSKNDYESLIVEDAKAACLEAVDEKSGYSFQGLGAYVEYRDDRVCFFIENLPQGRSVKTYRLRAETPGKFAALPAKIWAMYAPELKGNSDEFKFKTRDKD